MKTIKFIVIFVVAFLGIEFLYALFPTLTALSCAVYLSYEIAK
jgi:hypothetical protein